jgi:hypothetical protein
MKRIFAAALLLAGITAWSGAASAAKLHDFVDPPSHSKAQLLRQMRGPAFRPSREATVALFNKETGTRIGVKVDSFDQLMDFLGSLEVTVGPCNWTKEEPVRIFGVKSKTTFGSIHRGCYDEGTPEAELALYYHGVAIFSLHCGNLIADARERKHAELAPPPRPQPREHELPGRHLYGDGAWIDESGDIMPAPNAWMDP